MQYAAGCYMFYNRVFYIYRLAACIIESYTSHWHDHSTAAQIHKVLQVSPVEMNLKGPHIQQIYYIYIYISILAIVHSLQQRCILHHSKSFHVYYSIGWTCMITSSLIRRLMQDHISTGWNINILWFADCIFINEPFHLLTSLYHILVKKLHN